MKDYYLELIQLVPGDPKTAYLQAQQAKDEIRNEVMELEQQLEYVENLMQYLLPRVADAVIDEAPDWDTVLPVDRVRYIQDAALGLVRGGQTQITVQDIRHFFDGARLDLGVAQPNAVIGTVLASWTEFKKVDVNVFDHVGDIPPF